jgi:dihydroflavonol-4-reductase
VSAGHTSRETERNGLTDASVAPAQHMSVRGRNSGRGPRIAVVTGAAGFIGRHMVARLVREGWRVRALDIRNEDPAPGLPESDLVEWLTVDIRDSAALVPALEGAEVVIHLASAHLQHQAPPDWYSSVNVEGSRTLVRAAATCGVRRFIHASSVGIYGDLSETPADEDAPKNPTNEYERTKLLGEVAALKEARDADLELTILRPGWVYGPGCPRTAKLLRTIRRGRFFYVGRGTNLRHPIHVSDTVRAFVLAIDAASDTTGKPYLVVGPAPVEVRELVETCARIQGAELPRVRLPRPLVSAGLGAVELGFALIRREPPVSRRSLAFFDHDNAFTGAAAAEALGFEAEIGLEEGMRATLAELRPDPEGVPA